MDSFEIQKLLAALSEIKMELRLANAFELIKAQEDYSMTPNDAQLVINRALQNIKDNYGP